MNTGNTPLLLDPWLASSLLQKAIRRGEFDNALFAATSFYNHRGQGIWRRLVLIAFEDIGVADLNLVRHVTMLAVDKRYRLSLGTEMHMIFTTVMSMCTAVKDRSTDYLLSIAQDSRDLDDFRDWCFGQSAEALAEIAADAFVPLEKRAVAVWCTVAHGPSREFSRGEPMMILFDAFLAAGLPSALTEAVLCGVNLIKEPIVLFLLPMAHAIQRLDTSNVEELPPKVRLCRGVPTFCADRHTATGKAAIRRFVTENQRVGDTIGQYAPDFRAVDVAGYAVFHVEGGCVSLRHEWAAATALREAGTRIDLMKSGCAPEGVDEVLAVVRDNLDHLNDIRCRLMDRRPKPPKQPDLLDGEA